MIVVNEAFGGRRGNALNARSREYVVTGSGDDAILDDTKAMSHAFEFAPNTITATDGVTLPKLNSSIIEEIGINQLRIAVEYGEPGSGTPFSTPPVGTLEYEFNYQAPSVHVTQSLATMAVYTANGAIDPNTFRGAIGVVTHKNGTVSDVEGVDLAPGNTTNVWHYTITGKPSESYEALVENLMGCVNLVPFKNRPAGSMRFVSCTSHSTQGNKTQIRFGFQYEPNVVQTEGGTMIGSTLFRDGYTVGGIPVLEKRGHDYLWVHRVVDEVPAIGELLPLPKHVVIEQVFRYAALNDLGI